MDGNDRSWQSGAIWNFISDNPKRETKLQRKGLTISGLTTSTIQHNRPNTSFHLCGSLPKACVLQLTAWPQTRGWIKFVTYEKKSTLAYVRTKVLYITGASNQNYGGDAYSCLVFAVPYLPKECFKFQCFRFPLEFRNEKAILYFKKINYDEFLPFYVASLLVFLSSLSRWRSRTNISIKVILTVLNYL